jgi:membrane protein
VVLPEPPGDGARRPAYEERPGLVQRTAGRLIAIVEPLVARILGIPRIGMAHAVYMRYSAASGPVLARGLAFVALFALVPALLAVLSVAGLFVNDPAVQEKIVAIVAGQFPPLGPVIDQALQGFTGTAATSGVVSLVLLLWTASSLVRAVDGAFRVVFEDSGEGRTPIRDVVSVVAVAAGTFGAALALVLVTLPGPLADVIGVPSQPSRSAISLFLAFGLIALAYRVVPRPRPGWRMLWLPAAVAAIGTFVLTSLFAVVGPLLFGSAQLYGAFGAIFLGLVWLGYVTQLLLLGAAWVAERDRRERAKAPVASTDDKPGL